MVVREVTVHLEEHLRDFDIQALKNAMDHRPGSPVASVGDHLHASHELESGDDVIHIRSYRVDGALRAVAAFEIARLDGPTHTLNRLAMNGALAAHGFETVVVGRIVAAGDHHGAVGLQVPGRMIQHRRWDHANVRDIASGCPEALHQRVAQTW